MRITTLITVSRFAGLLFLNLFLFTKISPGQEEKEKISAPASPHNLYEKIQAQNFYSAFNKPVRFSDSTTYFVVLMTNRTCFECLKVMNEYTIELNKTNKMKIVVLSIIDSTTLNRKRSLRYNQSMFSNAKDYFFQYNNQSTETAFKMLSTWYSPAILLIRNKSVLHIPYVDVFDFSLNVKPEINKMITEFLK